MTSLAGSERAALCDLLDDVGPDAPTLCAGWTTYDLAAHLLLREIQPVAASGIAAPPLAALTSRASRRLKLRGDYRALVDRIRTGPPPWSPSRLPRIGAAFNTVEFFVHHEDVRRARPGWSARELPFAVQSELWSRLRPVGRWLARRSPVPVELVRTDTPAVLRVTRGEPPVVVRGLPSELTLLCYGRRRVAEVWLSGDDEAIERLNHSRLGW